MGALVPAMEERGVSRLIVLSAVGVGETVPNAPIPIRLGFRTLLRQIAKGQGRVRTPHPRQLPGLDDRVPAQADGRTEDGRLPR